MHWRGGSQQEGPTSAMILITAATGQIGGAALQAIAASGKSVRALVRQPSLFTGAAGVEIVEGNFDDDLSLRRALDGIEVMLLAGRDSPQSVCQHRRVLGHARDAGVRHIVKLSAIGATPRSPVALMREHAEVDKEVMQGPANWTFLKPHLFMQNLLRAADMIRSTGRFAAPMGQGGFPVVDTRDVGIAVATVLGDPAVHAGKSYALTGPAATSYDEVAATFTTVLGRPVTYEAVSPDEFESRLLSAGIPDWRAFDLAHIASAYGNADNDVSPDLAVLLGRDSTSLESFIKDHEEIFV